MAMAGQDSYNKRDEKGRRQGTWRGYFSSGSVRYEGNFVDDEPTGTFRYFYPEEQLRAELIHESGKEAVAATFYHRNSEVLGKGNYVNREMHGKWLFYNEQGVLVSEHEYKNGMNHGIWKVFYPDDTIAEKETWENGAKNGRFERYYPDGSVYMVANYENDLLNGTYELYFPNGNLLVKGEYVDNLNEGRWVYYIEEGDVRKTVIYENGEVIDETILIEIKEEEAVPLRPGPSREDVPWDQDGF
ncbi:MAG: hypothetical protein ABR597_12130 [Bacteroidales bacterium]